MTEINGEVCPKCGSNNLSKNGKRGGKRRYQCEDCGRHFTSSSKIEKQKSSWNEDKNNASGTIITAVKPGTKEEAAKLFQVDPELWVPVRMKINDWGVTNRDGQSFPNYQVSVWFDHKIDDVSPEEMAKLFRDKIANFKAPKLTKYKYKSDRDSLLEICIFDAHIGCLCWEEETGEKYDVEVAKKRFNGLLTDLLNKASVFNYGKIALVIGQDFLHTDTLNATTTKGTHQDVDGRWQKRFRAGEEVAVEAIERCRAIAPVDVIVIQGNHDWMSMYMLGEFLTAWYRGVSSVTIDNSVLARKYYLWNDVLLGYTHGEKEKIASLSAIMAEEQKHNWSIVNFKEFHNGHYHHEVVRDYLGLIVRNLKGSTGTDSWHKSRGYVGAIKGADAFIWEKGTGMTAHFSSNLVI